MILELNNVFHESDILLDELYMYLYLIYMYLYHTWVDL